MRSVLAAHLVVHELVLEADKAADEGQRHPSGQAAQQGATLPVPAAVRHPGRNNGGLQQQRAHNATARHVC